MPEERITALKVDETAVEMTDVMEGANDIVQKVETPLEKYPFITGLEPLKQTPQKRRFHMHFSERIADLHSKSSLTIRTSVPSPVVPVPGVGQVGEGLQNSWGLEEVDDDMEENDNSGEEQGEEVTKMEEVYQGTDNKAGCDNFAVLMEGGCVTVRSDIKVSQSEFGLKNFIVRFVSICR